jgi:phosphoglycolate phosphatase
MYKKGIILAIATSKDRRELDKALHYHGLSTLIDMSCCGKEYQEKPAPAMLYAIMEKFNVKPD